MTVNCQHCGKEFTVQASRLKWGRGRSCSRECQYASNGRKFSRQVTLNCIGCGAEFTRSPRHVGPTGKGKFCSRPCRDRNRTRDLHPQFIGARPDPTRGLNWQAQRRAAKRRDNGTCQDCGGVGTDVHHKIPFRLFDDYRLANRLSNLVTLCQPCHRRADAAFQAAERVA